MRIALAQYDPAWAEQFEEHRRRIAGALGGRASRIEHIGSTSVPRLAAKPVIDVIIGGVTPEDRAVRAALEAAGYAMAVDEPGHCMYTQPDRSVHVHLWSDPEQVERHLLFRDRLRADSEDRALYEHVKGQLAAREWQTPNDYAEAKTAVISTIVRRARGESGVARIERFAAIIAQYVASGGRILEIGAGEGLLARRLADRGFQVVALDTQLRSMFPIVEASFETFDAPPRSFDCVAAQLVLHHADDLQTLLQKMQLLLKPQGVAAIDDYGWERSADPQFRAARADLHTSKVMLPALRAHFEEIFYTDHAYLNDGAGGDSLGFTFIGRHVRKNASKALNASSIPRRP